MKPINVRTKVGAVVVLVLLLIVSFSSISAVQRLGTNPTTSVTWGIGGLNKITNSNGNSWNATGGNIQLAIDDLVSGNGTVWLPVANMIVDDTITLYPGLRIIGNGGSDSVATHLKTYTGGSSVFDFNNLDFADAGTGNSVVIKDMIISAYEGSDALINITGGGFHLIQNVHTVEVGGQRVNSSVRLYGTMFSRIADCFFRCGYTAGVYLEKMSSPSNLPCHNTVIEACTFNGPEGSGILVGDDAASVIIDACDFEGCGYANINLSTETNSGRTQNIIIRGCMFEESTNTYGINIDESLNTLIDGCRFYMNRPLNWRSGYFTITGTTISNCLFVGRGERVVHIAGDNTIVMNCIMENITVDSGDDISILYNVLYRHAVVGGFDEDRSTNHDIKLNTTGTPNARVIGNTLKGNITGHSATSVLMDNWGESGHLSFNGDILYVNNTADTQLLKLYRSGATDDYYIEGNSDTTSDLYFKPSSADVRPYFWLEGNGGAGMSIASGAFDIYEIVTEFISFEYVGGMSEINTSGLTLNLDPGTDLVIIDDVLQLNPRAAPPGSAAEGMIYADTDHYLYYYNGTAWNALN